MMNLATRRPRSRAIALAAAVACGLLAVTPAMLRQADLWLARYQLNCLLECRDHEATLYAEALAARGPTALSHLAEAMTADRAVVAQAALRALQRDIAEWDSLPPGERNRRLRLLAKALAARVDRLGPNARKFALRQAAKLLSQDGCREGDGAALGDCETILCAAASSNTPSGVPVGHGTRLAGDDSAAKNGRAERASLAAGHYPLVARSLALPGGSLPISPPVATPLAAGEFELEDERLEPSGPIGEQANRKDSSAMSPLRITLGDGDRRVGGTMAETALQVLPKPDVLPGASRPVEGPTTHVLHASYESQVRSQVPQASDAEDGVILASMHDLHDEDSRIVTAAEAALAERGFGTRELELARRLTHADHEIRRGLAEALPGIGGIDTKLWLTWLSRDRTADVRLAALTVMATTGHSQMLAHVVKVASDDDDARVRKLGERLRKPSGNDRRSP